jgi:curved DNA-binding protein CbpA
MAVVAGIKIKPKVKKEKVTSVSIRENAKRDYSPKWDGAETWGSAQFTRHFRNAMEYYRLEKTTKELKPQIINWMALNDYTKSEIAAFKKTKDNRCSMTVAALAACLQRGMPAIHGGFNEGRDSTVWLRKEIAKIVEDGKDDIDETETAKPVAKAVIYVPTIQDRLREAAGVMSEEIDAAIDSWIIDPEAFNPKDIKVVNLLKGKGAKAAHSRIIKGYFQRNYDELIELSNGKADEQLKEAYKHNSRKNVNKLIEFYNAIMAACEQIAAEQKVLKKPRAAKVKPAEELVKKLKFMLSDPKLGVTSVPPATIIGAQGVVVLNVKTRKIGYYIAKSSEGIGVKNSSLTNFTEKSMQKTMRKPPEQVKEFKEQNTQKRFETWFAKSVKTTETVLNGRFSEDTIILKVYK